MDGATNRRFYADLDATKVRYYTPSVRKTQVIDDLITLTALDTDPDGDGTFDVSWTLNSDFVLHPLNASADAEPWTRFEVHPAGDHVLPVDLPRSVRVTGKFGWSAVPAGIKEATMILASKLLRRAREAPFGIVVGVEGGMRIARMDPDVRSLIGPYTRNSLGIT